MEVKKVDPQINAHKTNSETALRRAVRTSVRLLCHSYTVTIPPHWAFQKRQALRHGRQRGNRGGAAVNSMRIIMFFEHCKHVHIF